MSGRTSIKGQGASIFFGDDPASGQPVDAIQPESDGSLDRSPTRASRDVSTSRRQRVDAPADPSPPAPASDDAKEFFEALVLPPQLRRRLRLAARGEHRFHTTIRLSRGDMDDLRDVCYELEARQGIAATRNDIGRLGLRLLLDDYVLRRKESVLVQVLQEDDQL